jgi:hypothetical protein
LLIVVLAFGSGFLLSFPPPSLSPAVLERIQPFLMLFLVLVCQAAVVSRLLKPDRVRLAWESVGADIAWLKNQPLFGWSLLLISFLLGILTDFNFYYNPDEGATLTSGWLISEGQYLYRDIFSHHFPFPYLWLGLVMWIFDPTVLVARLSLVFLKTTVFGGAMHLSKQYFPVGIAVLSWSIIGPFYLANNLLYDSFSALFLISAVFVTFAVIRGRTKAGKAQLIFIGTMLSLAVLSDPGMIFPGMIVFIALFLSALQPGTAPYPGRLITGLKQIRWAVFAAVLLVFVFLAGFALTGTLGDFYRQAVWFNQSVYSKYTSVLTLPSLIMPALKGLEIFKPDWYQETGLYFQWTDKFDKIDCWIFTGLFFRLCVLGFTFYLLSKRDWAGAALTYLMASFLLWRIPVGWHAQGFMLFAIACFALLLDAGLTPQPFKKPGQHMLISRANALILLIISCMFFWLHLRSIDYWMKNPSTPAYDTLHKAFNENSAFFQERTCGLANASLLLYPGRMREYFEAQIPPASRYIFMFPWVAEVGLDEVIAELEQKKDDPVLVSVNKAQKVWGYLASDYLEPMIRYLDQEYIQEADDLYVSPGLHRRCPAP